jgi:hypothetical protein
MLITQIQTILFTDKREVMGSHQFGCSLEQLIYDFGLNEYDIKSTINEQILMYCPLAMNYALDVQISFMKGNVRDIAFIDITINSSHAIKVRML